MSPLEIPAQFEIPPHFYGAVEAALVQANRIPKKAVGAFRGRLASLQKQGLLGRKAQPGKGHALNYGPDEFHRLVFATEMLQFGMSPGVVLDLVKASWDRRLREIFKKAEDAVLWHDAAGPDDIVLYLGGARLLADALSDQVPNINSCPLSKLADHMRMWMTMAATDPSGLPPRAMVVNLSGRLRAFHSHFASSYIDALRAETRRAKGGRKRE